MTQAPASAHPYASLSLAQVIGLNLARLYAWLVRFEATGAQDVPSDIVHMVVSSDWQVHAFIRMLTSNQLERAGFTSAALAMRDPIRDRTMFNGSREPAAHIERTQGCTPVELIQRLEKNIDQFERAEEIANSLARIILLTLLYMSPEAISAIFSIRPDVGRPARLTAMSEFYARLASREQKREAATRREIKPMSQGPPHIPLWVHEWHVLDPGSPPGKAGVHMPRPPNSFPGVRKRIRDLAWPLNRSLNSENRASLSADTRENGYPRLKLIKCFGVKGVDPRSSLGSAVERPSTEPISGHSSQATRRRSASSLRGSSASINQKTPRDPSAAIQAHPLFPILPVIPAKAGISLNLLCPVSRLRGNERALSPAWLMHLADG